MIFIRDRPNKNWERLEARVSGDTSSNTSSGLYLEGWSGYVEWNGFQPKISSAETLVVLLPCCRNEMGKRDKRVVRLSMLLWQLEDMKVYFLFCRSCLCLFTSWQVSILSIFMKSCGNTDTVSNELLDNHVRLNGDVITSICIRTVVYLFNYFVSNLTEIWLMHFLKILQAVNYMWFLNLEEANKKLSPFCRVNRIFG